MPLPRSFTTVTPLSATLALIFFISLPFLGFYLGMRYQKVINSQTATQTIHDNTNASDREAAKKQVENFYMKWLDPKRYTSDYKENFEATIDSLLKEGFITQKAADQLKNREIQYDVATCSQNPLPYNQYQLSDPTIQEETATMDVSGRYSGPPATEKKVSLNLIKSGSQWAIDSFTCPTP